MSARADAAAVKRRQILEAAVHVFARQGFNAGRISDIADQAGVAHGLVYHYFDSKEAILDEVFSDRWALLLDASRQVYAMDLPARDKLARVAQFIIESYRFDPDLMKVIIVEVTRAANTFGRTHLKEISEAYSLISGIVREGQEAGDFRTDVSPDYAALAFYGAIEQILTGWIFEVVPAGDGDSERATDFVVETVCGGLGQPSRGTPAAAGSD
jgi:AcrR family transcriptional regulator